MCVCEAELAKARLGGVFSPLKFVTAEVTLWRDTVPVQSDGGAFSGRGWIEGVCGEYIRICVCVRALFSCDLSKSNKCSWYSRWFSSCRPYIWLHDEPHSLSHSLSLSLSVTLSFFFLRISIFYIEGIAVNFTTHPPTHTQGLLQLISWLTQTVGVRYFKGTD